MIEEPNLDKLRKTARQSIADEDRPSPEIIREIIDDLRSIPRFAVSAEAAEALAKEIESQLDISMTIGSVVKGELREWYDAAQAQIDPYYWNRYRQLLGAKSFPPDVVAKIDQVTSRIVGLLENPKREGDWSRRGMVVGHVQSGKTANYTGLICKAADAGYKLIIVIAGIHNNLRSQTQQRIDEGFVGRDSSSLARGNERKIIGVGRFDSTRAPLTVTNVQNDFRRTTAETFGVELRSLNVPAVLVIKKNPSTLRHVIAWLTAHNARGDGSLMDAPMLLIDDEADNASINTSGNAEQTTKINGLIRTLLRSFRRKCYVGYTATPFANIFIDPDSTTEMLDDDLFPEDFIVSLDPPSNYFGALRIFGPDRNERVLQDLTDTDVWLPLKHKKDFPVENLPDSLKDAIRSFVIVRAIRLLRGEQRAHNSMLVNVSRFTDVQTRLRNIIHHYVSGLQATLRLVGELPVSQALMNEEVTEIHRVWSEQFGDTGHSWEAVLRKLHDSAAPIRVEEVNSRSAGKLNYEDHGEFGLNVIAVGGLSLSRGLTLEGLTVSYFLRNSIMYDTLLQMGRWFGYRPGYEDLCRIWMPPEASGWYMHITESIEELRDELRLMEQAGLTPRDFGLKVRSHPDTLIVTAKNKMGTGRQHTVSIGLAKEFIETVCLPRAPTAVEQNMSAVENLVDALQKEKSGNREKNGFLWSDVGVASVLAFIRAFKNDKSSVKTETGPVSLFIEEGKGDELGRWDVLLVSLAADDEKTAVAVSGLPVFPQERALGRGSTDKTIRVTSNQRVASRGVEVVGVNDEDRLIAEESFRKNHPEKGKDGKFNYPDYIYRWVRKRPLLLVHVLKIKLSDVELSEPMAAWSISFPEAPLTGSRIKTVEYVVNTTWWRENFGDEADDDESEIDNV